MPGLDVSLIEGLPPFRGLPRPELEEIVRLAAPRRIPGEGTIFGQEEEAKHFFVLLDGHARVVKTRPDGQQMIVRYVTAGEIIGIAVAMGRSTYPASAIAAVDCVALAWPSSQWPELSRKFPALGANTLSAIGDRLQETHEKVIELATEQVEQRVALALLRLVRQTGRKSAGGIEIDFPLSRQDIAEMTGATLHTVSRLLAAWEGQGIVAGGRRKVTVSDPHRLVMISEGRKPQA